MSMNRNDEITANFIEEKRTLHPERIDSGNDNQNLSLKKVATVSLFEKAKANPNDDNNKNERINSSKMDGDQLRRDAQNPIKQKQKRILGIKRHASPSLSRISGDMCLYKTMHPCRIDVKTIVQNGVTKKSKMIHDELSKQEQMIKSQGHELTKKYKLLNSDLRKLLRSTSEGNGMASSSSDSGSPQRVLTLSA